MSLQRSGGFFWDSMLILCEGTFLDVLVLFPAAETATIVMATAARLSSCSCLY